MNPPTADGRTRSVGHVHVLDGEGRCLETCPHPAHAGPVQVTLPAGLKPLLDEWLGNLGIETTYFPTRPDDPTEGLRQYLAAVPPSSPAARLLREHPMESLLRGDRP